MSSGANSITSMLNGVRGGDRAALDRLMPIIYGELRRIAGGYLKRERPDHTLQPTALVNEAYLRLIEQRNVAWESRAHFFGVAANLMRRILVDHARARQAAKRAGGIVHVPIEEVEPAGRQRDIDLLALDEVLERLAGFDPKGARIVELRYFAGLTTRETAEVLDLSTATVEREWAAARGWLRRELLRRGGR